MRRTLHSSLYSPRPAFQTSHLNVGDGHSLYYEVSGNPDGIPVVFLHGGPGGSVSPNSRRFFSSEAFKLCMFDQRGTGKSEPFCSLENNTTQALISDIENLREHLEIDKWLVFGGSWGSTLALAYAQAHPQRVSGLVLRGLFLGTQSEIDWFMTGPKSTHPEVWHSFAELVEESEAGPMLSAYWERLTSNDHAIKLEAARAWSLYESSLVTLHPNPDVRQIAHEPESATSVALLEAHYFRNACFFEPDQLLKNLDKITHIPTTLVQGRYDVICPTYNTWRLREAWSQLEAETEVEKSTLQIKIVPDAGHASVEPGTASALRDVLDKFAVKLKV